MLITNMYHLRHRLLSNEVDEDFDLMMKLRRYLCDLKYQNRSMLKERLMNDIHLGQSEIIVKFNK